jgi:hypothetical protein
MHRTTAGDFARGINVVKVAEEPDQTAVGPEVRIVQRADWIALGFAQEFFVGRGHRSS